MRKLIILSINKITPKSKKPQKNHLPRLSRKGGFENS